MGEPGAGTPGARARGGVSAASARTRAPTRERRRRAPPPRGPSRFGANLQFPSARPAAASMGPLRPQVSAARSGGLPVGAGAAAGGSGGGLRRLRPRFPGALQGLTSGASWATGRLVGSGRASLRAGAGRAPQGERGGGSPRPPVPPPGWSATCAAHGGALARRAGVGGPASEPGASRPAPPPSAFRLAAAPAAVASRGARAAVGRRRAGGRCGRKAPRGRGEAAPLCGRRARSLGGAEGVAAGRGGGRPRGACGGAAPSEREAGRAARAPGRRAGPRPSGSGEGAFNLPVAVPGLPAGASACWPAPCRSPPVQPGPPRQLLRPGAPPAAAGDARNGPFCAWGRIRAGPGFFCSSPAPAQLRSAGKPGGCCGAAPAKAVCGTVLGRGRRSLKYSG